MNNEDDIFGQQIDKHEPDYIDEFKMKWSNCISDYSLEFWERDVDNIIRISFLRGYSKAEDDFGIYLDNT